LAFSEKSTQQAILSIGMGDPFIFF